MNALEGKLVGSLSSGTCEAERSERASESEAVTALEIKHARTLA